MGVSGRLPPRFVSDGWRDAAVTEVALVGHVGVLHAHAVGSVLLVHTSPHVGEAHAGRPQAVVVVLGGPLGAAVSVAHGVHAVAVGTMVGRIHAGLGRRSRLQRHWSGSQRWAVHWTHVRVLLVIRIWADWVPGAHVVSFDDAVLWVKRNKNVIKPLTVNGFELN